MVFWLGQMGFEFHSKEKQMFDKKQTLHVTFIQNSFKKEHLYYTNNNATVFVLIACSSFVNSNLIKKRKLRNPASTSLVFYINIIN